MNEMASGKSIMITVTAETDIGQRPHMEDYLDIKLSPSDALLQIPDWKDQVFVGVFDGHGGKEAALYVRKRLWDLVQEQSNFRTTDRQLVVEAIRDAYWALHGEMEPLRRTWKRNKDRDLSTAGTTASIVVFRKDHFYVANVGDSSVVMAVQDTNSLCLRAQRLTKDHKPEDPEEIKRIENLGGQVKVSRKGVARVVRERFRPSIFAGEEDTIDLIPYLNISRCLGDFWSFNKKTQKFVVSPNPDVQVHSLDLSTQKFIVLASDGLWNAMTPQEVVDFVWAYEQGKRCMEEVVDFVSAYEQGKRCIKNGKRKGKRDDVGRALIDEALKRYQQRNMLADNIAVVIVFHREMNGPLPESVPGPLPESVPGPSRSSQPAVPITKTAQETVVIHHGSKNAIAHVRECHPNGSPYGLYFKLMMVEEGPENAGEGGKRVSPGKRSEEPADVKLPPSKKRHAHTFT